MRARKFVNLKNVNCQYLNKYIFWYNYVSVINMYIMLFRIPEFQHELPRRGHLQIVLKIVLILMLISRNKCNFHHTKD